MASVPIRQRCFASEQSHAFIQETHDECHSDPDRQPESPLPVRLRAENFLFHRREDPAQTRNLWAEAPVQRKRLPDLLRHLLAEEGCPPEQYERLGLS